MMITLDKPYTVGDLAPDESYPHVYVTTFFVNGPALMATIGYEIGTMGPANNTYPLGQWTRAPLITPQMVTLQSDQLYPFFTAKGAADDADTALWDQVEKVIYTLVQGNDSRLTGTVA